jgi:predicted dehydrogenase
VVGVIGAGGFAKGILLPALIRTAAEIRCIADLDGAVARHSGVKFKAARVTTDHRQVLDDPAIRSVFIVVGHHLHARFVVETLEAGKHAFVEKPLAMNRDQLEKIRQTLANARDQEGEPLTVTVGFNRRFSPHGVRLKSLLTGRSEPLCMSMTVNAGMISAEHWTQDPDRGGGRIIGEACHFIDLMVFLTGSPVSRVAAMRVGEGPTVRDDKMTIALSFADGSVGSINYFANGSKSYPKETLEVFSDGRVLRLDNFRKLTGYGVKGFKRFGTWRQDKGHQTEIAAYIERLTSGGEPLIPFDELENVTLASFAAVEAASAGTVVRLS